MSDKKNRYLCKPNNEFKDICIKDDTGQYKSKDGCINDCENKYINTHLIKAHIKGETMKFYLFIKDIIKDHFNVYLKGGNVLGLMILKMIYNKYKNDDDKFESLFDDFLQLNLIKDWDFTAYTKIILNDTYRKKLDDIAAKYKLVPRAKTFILYQTQKPMLIDNNALFEISVLDSENYTKLEIPLTTMKIKVNEYNVKYVFILAKMFLSYKLTNEPFDLDMIKRVLSKFEINIHPSNKGLYSVKNLDMGNLSNKMINFIKDFSKKDNDLMQFLIIHVSDLFRLLYRLPVKNLPKTDLIADFIKNKLDDKIPSWLLDTGNIKIIVNKFVDALSNKTNDIYVNYGVNSVVEFFDGINFNRLRSDYKILSDDSKTMLIHIFKPLIDNNIDNPNNNSLISLTNFIKQQKGGYYDSYTKYKSKYLLQKYSRAII